MIPATIAKVPNTPISDNVSPSIKTPASRPKNGAVPDKVVLMVGPRIDVPIIANMDEKAGLNSPARTNHPKAVDANIAACSCHGAAVQ